MTTPAPRSATAPAGATAAGTSAPPAVGLGSLWFGLLGAPAAWSVQAVVDYALAAHMCFPDMVPLRAPLLEPLSGVVLGISVLAVLLGALALLSAIRSWRRGGGAFGEPRATLVEERPPEGRVRFMALAGILVSAVFLMGIIFHGMGAFLLNPCK